MKVKGLLLGAVVAAVAGSAHGKGIEEPVAALPEPVTVNDSLSVSFFLPDPASLMLRNRLVNTPAPGTIVERPIDAVSNN